MGGKILFCESLFFMVFAERPEEAPAKTIKKGFGEKDCNGQQD